MLHGDGGFGRDALGQEHAGGVEEGLAAGGQELAAIGQVGAELAAALAGFRDDDEKGARHRTPPQQEGAVPATGQNTLRLPKCALSAPSQRKPLESHDLVTTPRVHHASRRRGDSVAGRRASRAADLRPTRSAMKGIAEWLASIGLSEYAQRFADNAIDLSVLRDLTEQDLKDLGVLLGHRRKILLAIAELDRVAPAPTETATAPALRGDSERRHLTVMICDLVGSTALSARLDPEDMRAVIHAYHAACARITRTHDGFLAQFRGDGILAYFGYPLAHEDNAERTVRAALDIIAAVARLETPAGEPLAVRIGIASGFVVIGDLSREGALRERVVVGETPKLAAHLQGLAEPGTVVVAASTRRLLGAVFHLRDLGLHEIEGFAEPVAAWAVEGAFDSATASRQP